MFDWLKKKELQRIIELEMSTTKKEYTILELESNIRLLESRLQDAIKIANGKRIVKCLVKTCMDYDSKTESCTLDRIKVKPNGVCEDFDTGSAMIDLNAELKIKG